MPLTERQKVSAFSPYRLPPKYLYELMELLSDKTLWPELGSERIGVIRTVMYAAHSKNMTIPVLFQRAFDSVNDPNEFVVRIKDHSPTGTASGKDVV